MRQIEVTDEMIRAGVEAFGHLCPMDIAFPVGGEEVAVEAALRAALRVRDGAAQPYLATHKAPKASRRAPSRR